MARELQTCKILSFFTKKLYFGILSTSYSNCVCFFGLHGHSYSYFYHGEFKTVFQSVYYLVVNFAHLLIIDLIIYFQKNWRKGYGKEDKLEGKSTLQLYH